MKINRLGSRLYRGYVEHVARPAGGPRLLRKARTAAFKTARALLTRAGDPIVAVPVGRRELLMHLSHPLPLYMACAPLYDRALPRIAAVLRKHQGRVTAIDVGANIGDSAALLSDAVADAEILCIEGSPAYFELLTANVARLGLRVQCVQAYCGDGGPSGVVPSDQRGTGRLTVGATASSAIAVTTLDEIVSGEPRFAAPNLLKVDTDGFDFRVLRGAQRILSEAKPLIYFELDPQFLRDAGEDPLSIFPLLASLGYGPALLYGNIGTYLDSFDAGDVAFVRSALGRIERGEVAYFDVLAVPASERSLFDELAASESRSAR